MGFPLDLKVEKSGHLFNFKSNVLEYRAKILEKKMSLSKHFRDCTVEDLPIFLKLISRAN